MLRCSRWHPGLYEYLQGCPFLTDLTLENHQQRVLDFRQSHLIELAVELAGVEELYLNDGLEELILLDAKPEACHIHAGEKGAALQLSVQKTIGRYPALKQLSAIHCREVEELDLAELSKDYPHLRELRLWGKPGYIRNFAALEQFRELRAFTTVDLFGFSAQDIPDPDKMKKLTRFWMGSLPEDAAKAAKKLYKKQEEQGLDLWIHKARNPEWLAQNLDNPFRSWDGQDNISAANAKKAAAQYRKTRGELLQLAQGPDGRIAELAAAIVRDYTEAFNKMDRRSGFIETEEREEIYTVLCSLLALLPNCAAISNTLFELFDSVRDF